jgi:hypothetical protein
MKRIAAATIAALLLLPAAAHADTPWVLRHQYTFMSYRDGQLNLATAATGQHTLEPYDSRAACLKGAQEHADKLVPGTTWTATPSGAEYKTEVPVKGVPGASIMGTSTLACWPAGTTPTNYEESHRAVP